jgi:diguanylate cyclase (GGDEF)-like protein
MMSGSAPYPDNAPPRLPVILCVDDEPSVRAAVKRLLHKDFKVLEADSAAKALELLEAHPEIAVVLSDQRMPGMSGLDLLLEVRNRAPDAVRAILSGHMDITDLTHAINQAQIHRFILKPWDNEYLRLQMLEALAEHTVLREKNELERLSITDPVTNLANHRHFQDRLRIEVDRAIRYGAPVSLVMVDIDHFKRFNDQFGHPAGDEILRLVGSRLTVLLRGHDLVARYGGEEFAIILPETAIDGAYVVCERMRANFAQDAFPGPEGNAAHLTISCGVASLPMHGTTAPELIAKADQMLYQAKRQGRNQTVAAPHLSTTS